ncbi:leucine-rich_repeat domain-containing protein [Hexamita inflata]|uniref:Leucine-rich repeat domain-containing protein n=1 Tax=Hexamita inflata TaxID=28002 RepID=A0AA86QP14_9EUKA|nr:leucine-rich repeat domain-containing protein [Hexamita inflata]
MEDSKDSQDSSINSQNAELSSQIDISYEFSTELNLIDEFKSKIMVKSLKIKAYAELYNIEFVNDLDIEELIIEDCQNVIPNLNNFRIKKLQFISCRIQYLNKLKLPNLEALTVLDSQYQKYINSLQNFGEFKNLKELVLVGYKNLDLKLIPDLQLTKLKLSQCNLNNIQLLKQFNQLTNLDLRRNPDIDIRPLQQMLQLTILNLYDCCLKNVDSIKYLVQLKDLDLSFNQQLNILPLQHLKQLVKLNLEYCSLIDLTYLKPLTNLKLLVINQNNIVFLEQLRNLNQIQCFFAQNNKVIDVSVLNSHPNLFLYQMDDQEQPNAEEIAFATKLRDINAQITYIRQISKLQLYLKHKITLQRDKVNKWQQHLYYSQTQFIGQVTLLFQKLSSFQSFQ